MKLVTVLGTRPELIRLSRIIPLLDGLCHHVVVHTGQNFDPRLGQIFYEDLGIRQPDHLLTVQGDTFGEQAGSILAATGRVLLEEKPDRLLILGDTNSALSSIVAKRQGIRVYHMEAGNRCYDDRVPEEVNRRIVDHSSDVLLPYTERSRANLIREGIAGQRIYVTGNPIFEVLQHYRDRIDASGVLAQVAASPKAFFLVTMHRAENVDRVDRLRSLCQALDAVQRQYAVPVIVSTHPRTQSRLREFGAEGTGNSGIRFLDPFNFSDFVRLERDALCVLSDSGTVQEECAILGVPNVTIRDVTERPETMECGSNILSGVGVPEILGSVAAALTLTTGWTAPDGYLAPKVSETVAKIVLSV